MFVTGRPCAETGESASALDLIYTGCLTDDGDGNPILPSQQNENDAQIQSASSSRSYAGVLLTSPASIQFYAPSNVLSYFSYLAPGTTEAPAPSAAPTVITWTVGDTSYAITDPIADLIAAFFTLQVNTVPRSTEVVSGKFWQNSSRKTVVYVPFIFTLPSGPFLSLASAGINYQIGDTLTVTSGGETATVVVDSVFGAFGAGGGIYAWHETSDTFTVTQTLLPASGGSGSGAQFNVNIIP